MDGCLKKEKKRSLHLFLIYKQNKTKYEIFWEDSETYSETKAMVAKVDFINRNILIKAEPHIKTAVFDSRCAVMLSSLVSSFSMMVNVASLCLVL